MERENHVDEQEMEIETEQQAEEETLDEVLEEPEELSSRQNFYVLLELATDPLSADASVIKTAIQTKKEEWTRLQDNPERRNEALACLDLLPEVERVMLSPDLQGAEAEEARALREDALRRFEAELRILEGKGHILPREAAALTVKYRAYGIDREQVIAAAHCPIDDLAPERSSEEISGEILDRITARKLQKNLKLLGYEDLYAFLGAPPYSSVKKLQEAIESKSGEEAAGEDSKAAIGRELLELSGTLFRDYDAKQTYDRFLKVGAYPELAEMVDRENSRSGHISPEILLRLVNFGVETHGLTVLEAEEAIRRYCAAYGILIGDGSSVVACPACGGKTDRDGMACAHCAAPLQGECPGCGTPFEHGAAVCSACGFVLADMVIGLRNISEAENAIIEKNWSTAQRCLQYAKKYWPGHPKIAPLEQGAVALAERYAHYVDAVNDCMRNRQFYAAQAMIGEAAAENIQLPAATVAKIDRVLEDLEDRIGRLQQEKEEPSFDEVLALTEMVTDSMELNRMMRGRPPKAPDKLNAKIRGLKVRLTWPVSKSPGQIEYVLVRKQGGPPLTAFDGDILYQGPANSFADETAPALSDNYYCIYALRGGTYSESGSAASPVLIIPEIEDLHILPLDAGAKLTWAFNPDLREVIIWRKLGGERPEKEGEGIRLDNTRLDGFIDTKIKNGVEYWYYVVAVYIINGHAVTSKGVCDKVIPHKLLAPIDRMMVAKADGGGDEYVVNWQSGGYQDVLLFSSPHKPDCRTGDMLPVKQLLAAYRKVDLESTRPDSARFRLRWSGGVFLFTAAIAGTFATVGEIRYLANVEDVESLTHDFVDNSLFLNMKWPKEITEVEVNYRFDRFPEKPGEKGSATFLCSREQYEFDAGVRIRDPEKTIYYISVYSTFVTPDGERIYSDGVQAMVNNTAQQEIFYQFNCRKRWFSSKSMVSLTVSSEKKFMMPKAVVVGRVGRLPLNKTDGVQLFEIDREVKVEDMMAFDYRTTALPANLYLRMFFEDDELYTIFRPLPLGKIRVT